MMRYLDCLTENTNLVHVSVSETSVVFQSHNAASTSICTITFPHQFFCLPPTTPCSALFQLPYSPTATKCSAMSFAISDQWVVCTLAGRTDSTWRVPVGQGVRFGTGFASDVAGPRRVVVHTSDITRMLTICCFTARTVTLSIDRTCTVLFIHTRGESAGVQCHLNTVRNGCGPRSGGGGVGGQSTGAAGLRSGTYRLQSVKQFVSCHGLATYTDIAMSDRGALSMTCTSHDGVRASFGLCPAH